MESIGEKCAVFGIYAKDLDVSRLTFFGLYALQHRGQEGSGIATTDGKKISSHKDIGLVSSVYNEEAIKRLTGISAIGHNRYSTSAGTGTTHLQPVEVQDGTLALVHNGNISSTKLLEDFLETKKVATSGLSDSHLITEALHVCLKEGISIEDSIKKIFPLLTGSFSLLILNEDKLIAVRDTYGIRPLSIATLDGGYVCASETCAFNPIGATFLRDVRPGEMIIIDADGMRSEQMTLSNQKLDIFEFVYFSRPDSVLLGKSVYEVRKNFGGELASEHPISADVVIPVPETAIPVALGYAQATGTPLEMGLVKSRYIHRTFIEPKQYMREQGVKLKLAALKEVIENKRVVVIDDSIVRGTTSKQIVKMLFEVGAREVHFLVSSPPVRFPDFYGIDLPKQNELLASTRSISEMNTYLGSTSLHFLSFEGMIKATGLDESLFSTACFNGVYPIDILERISEVHY